MRVFFWGVAESLMRDSIVANGAVGFESMSACGLAPADLMSPGEVWHLSR